MDQKSRKVISGLPAQDSLPGLCEAFFGAAETLQKRLCNASDTPQKHSRRHPHLHLYVFSHRGEFHDQCARWSTPNARASAPSSFLRPLTPDSAPDFGTCCLKYISTQKYQVLAMIFPYYLLLRQHVPKSGADPVAGLI